MKVLNCERCVLRDARKLIFEKGWCQGVPARDANGNKVGRYSDEAVCFCVEAATEVASNRDYYAGVFAREALRKVISKRDIWQWNDHPKRTKEEVLAAFDESINLLNAAK